MQVRKVEPYSLNIKGRLVEINRPQVMGILNVTPDSFFSESRAFDAEAISHRIATMVAEGVDIIDIGAYSSRPGAGEVSSQEEMQRLAMGMEILKEIAPSVLVSVDTFRADVARYAVETLGVDIVNDISAGLLDDDMVATVAQLKVPYIAMHMRGTPTTMSEMCRYDNVTADVLNELSQRINAFTLAGINDIIIDPGFGFAKTVEQNYELLQNLELFNELGYPLLVGMSRKSMLYRALEIAPEDALNATTVANTIALQKGASILRVHDVKQAVEAVKIMMLTNK